MKIVYKIIIMKYMNYIIINYESYGSQNSNRNFALKHGKLDLFTVIVFEVT